MSKVHVLSGSANTYNCTAHTPTPAGNNSAGVSWVTCLVNSGMAKTVMTSVGNGPGQITTAEKADIEAGNVIECRFQWTDQGLDGPGSVADLNARADLALTERLSFLGEQLKYFGYAGN